MHCSNITKNKQLLALCKMILLSSTTGHEKYPLPPKKDSLAKAKGSGPKTSTSRDIKKPKRPPKQTCPTSAIKDVNRKKGVTMNLIDSPKSKESPVSKDVSSSHSPTKPINVVQDSGAGIDKLQPVISQVYEQSVSGTQTGSTPKDKSPTNSERAPRSGDDAEPNNEQKGSGRSTIMRRLIRGYHPIQRVMTSLENSLPAKRRKVPSSMLKLNLLQVQPSQKIKRVLVG